MAPSLLKAIDNGNEKAVRKILRGRDCNVTKDWLDDGSLVGPPLLLAVDNLDVPIVELLVDEFGADVNHEISISGHESTLLIYAIKCLLG